MTTHKIITNAVHIACLTAAVYIFIVWREGVVSGGYTTEAPQMLRYIAWVEITNLTQYAAKSGYDHHLGIFDGAAQAAVQGMDTDDLANGPAQAEQAAKQDAPVISPEDLPKEAQ